MPTAMKACRGAPQGCGARVPAGTGWCPACASRHGKADDRARDRSQPWRAWYKTSAWQKYRAWFLAQHPLCGERQGGRSAEHSECAAQGRAVAATVVDHIRPHRGNRALFDDPGNHQALCGSCHGKKTVAEDGGFGRGGS